MARKREVLPTAPFLCDHIT